MKLFILVDNKALIISELMTLPVRYRTAKQRCYASNYQNAMQIRVTRIWQARGDRNLASAISKGPVAVLLYNFHGVSVEGYKSGSFST
jgi:hypothetical protein